MSVRTVRIFRYDPEKGGSGHFDTFSLQIENETTTTILDVLLRVQREQDPSLAFRYACRVNMCGSCGMVINGVEGLACKTNVSQFPPGKEITIRPLNHFPVVKDLVVDMEAFFKKFEETLPFFEPKAAAAEPAQIRPDSRERQDIGLSTECIACGCCVSSCTMCRHHEGYAGPAALNRAFTLLADSRDALFEPRLVRALASCYSCRTEFNCTEVCPKNISGTRAIKYIQRLALKHARSEPKPAPSLREHEAAPPAAKQAPPATAQAAPEASCCAAPAVDRRTFLRQVGVGVIGLGTALVLGGIATGVAVGPTLAKSQKQWAPLGKLSEIPKGEITTLMLRYELKTGPYTQPVAAPVLVSRLGESLVCFKSSCTHLGCIVRWDALSGRFLCACHGGTFDRDGNVVAGPPPRPLDRYAFRLEGDQLFVEVG